MSFSLGKGLVGLGKDGIQAILTADQSSKNKYVLNRKSHTFLSGEPQRPRLELERKKIK